MLKCAFLLMQKNENELLRAWLAYHSRLTEPQDIYIFDNGSSTKETLTILSEAEAKGVNVNREFATDHDYERKHEIIRTEINRLIADQNYDFIIPLDCDEFLAVQNDCSDQIHLDKSSIFDELMKYSAEHGVLGAKGSYFNDPGQSFVFFFYKELSVLFNSNSSVETIDHGYHNATLERGDRLIDTNVILLHFHFKRLEMARAYAAEKLKNRVHDFSVKTFSSYSGIGHHLARLFLIQPEEYNGWLVSNATRRQIPEFLMEMRSINASFPEEFYDRSDRYALWRLNLEQNPFFEAVLDEGITKEELLLILRYASDATELLMFSESSILPFLLSSGLDKASVCCLPYDRLGQILYYPQTSKVSQIGEVRIAKDDLQIDFLIGNLILRIENRNADQKSEHYRQIVCRESHLLIVLMGHEAMLHGSSALAFEKVKVTIVVLLFWSDPRCHGLLRGYNVIDTEGDSVVLNMTRSN